MQMKSSWRARSRGWWWYETKVQVGVREEMVGFIYPYGQKEADRCLPSRSSAQNQEGESCPSFCRGENELHVLLYMHSSVSASDIRAWLRAKATSCIVSRRRVSYTTSERWMSTFSLSRELTTTLAV